MTHRMHHTRLPGADPSSNHRPRLDVELSGPLRIAEVPIPVSGSLGIAHCPGRNRIDSAGCQWKRNLRDDLRDLAAWGAGAVLTLVEDDEFARLGVPEFAAEIRKTRLFWYHMPIPDMSAPGTAFDEGWSRDGARIFESLRDGGRLVVHCAGGLGRSGMIAAKLLIALGASADHAVAAVREARPGAIETGEQVDYVLNGPSLAPTAARRWQAVGRPLAGLLGLFRTASKAVADGLIIRARPAA